MADELVRTIHLDCSVEHAFAVFTEMVDLWWPRGHRKYRDGTLRLEPADNGALIDRATDGTEWIMGRVVAIDPPRRLTLDWYPGSAAAPTSVEISFAHAAGGSTITVIHRPLPDSQTIWPVRAATFAAGWDAVLPAVKSCAEEN